MVIKGSNKFITLRTVTKKELLKTTKNLEVIETYL